MEELLTDSCTANILKDKLFANVFSIVQKFQITAIFDQSHDKASKSKNFKSVSID